MSGDAFTDRCDLDDLGTRDLVEGWREVFARIVIPFDAHPDPALGERFHARAVRQRVGDLSIVDFEYGRGVATRGRREIAATDGDPIGFTVFSRGRVGHASGAGSAVVVTGQAVLWDGARPGTFAPLSPIVGRTLMIPRDRLRAVLPAYERSLGPVPRTSAAVDLLVRYLDTLASVAPGLDTTARRDIEAITIELLRAALGATMLDTPTLRMTLVTEARRYIDQHLNDPGLNPTSVARAHLVSVRSLHQAFEEAGESVGALILRRRLSRCYADLSRSVDDQVFTIAKRWGFRSAAHFSRAFRREFGISPREVRPPR
jgi:AraC family transcriptional regulator, positive regulator of tynA and feaB